MTCNISSETCKLYTPRISIEAVIYIPYRHYIAPFLDFMPLLQSHVPRACKQGIKSKAGAIKCCKEIKITAPPNEWRNISFFYLFQVKSTLPDGDPQLKIWKNFQRKIKSLQELSIKLNKPKNSRFQLSQDTTSFLILNCLFFIFTIVFFRLPLKKVFNLKQKFPRIMCNYYWQKAKHQLKSFKELLVCLLTLISGISFLHPVFRDYIVTSTQNHRIIPI